MNELLSDKLRPNKLDDIVGQNHLIGENKILTNWVNNNKLFSIILFGHPGIGKTSIAITLVNELKVKYRMLNAVINNKKDFDIVIEEAKMYDGLVLIMDEIHRLNKDKQDLLLPYLENGLITLIGMTTSNPYHSINPAIRSRCQLIELYDLTHEDIVIALKSDKIKKILTDIIIEPECYDFIATASGYDLRYAYNLLEIAYFTTTDKHITKEVLKNVIHKNNIFHDKDGDGYYNLLSAFQKSIRGSDVDASIYYLARLIIGGDIEAICRRLSVIVYEDIGLANPNMGPRVDAAINCALRLGLPEARIPLSEIVIELALSPKSNSAECAIDKALSDIELGNTGDVPKHLHNGNPNYLYPHDYPNNFVKQQYLPDKIKNNRYYYPKNNKNEKTLNEIMTNINKIKKDNL